MKASCKNGLLLSALALCGSLAAHASTVSYYNCSTTACATGGAASYSSSYAATRYPLVFAPGIFGYSYNSSGSYWYGIPADLVANGASVYVTQQAGMQSAEVRGEQLLQQVRLVLAISGAGKVNLVGHSYGALSARYVAGVVPGQVASVTTVGGANNGSPVADVLLGLTTIPGVGTIAASVATAITNGLAASINQQSGESFVQNSMAALTDLSHAGITAFNARYPAGMPAANSPCGQGAASANSINYYSWGGTGIFTNLADGSDYGLALSSLAFGLQASDGLIGQCSSHLGTVIRDNYNMNHLDLINQTNAMVSIFEASPVSLYRLHANRLKLAGR